MDLEKFPTSPMAQKMIKMVSNGFYDDSYVGKWIYQVMGAQLDIFADKVEELPDQAFVDEATWGLSFWEQLVGIPIREDLDVEERRIRIKQKLNNAHPVSPGWLDQYIENLTGEWAEIIEHPKTYTFSVEIGLGPGKDFLTRLIKYLNEVKPAHLSYDIKAVLGADHSLYFGAVTADYKKITTGCEKIEVQIFGADDPVYYGHIQLVQESVYIGAAPPPTGYYFTKNGQRNIVTDDGAILYRNKGGLI